MGKSRTLRGMDTTIPPKGSTRRQEAAFETLQVDKNRFLAVEDCQVKDSRLRTPVEAAGIVQKPIVP